MSNKRFNETNLPNDIGIKFDRICNILIAPSQVYKAVEVLFAGTSAILGIIKDKDCIKGIKFTNNGEFIAAAQISITPCSSSDSDEKTSGFWNYTWTFYEEDTKDCKFVDDSSLYQVYKDKSLDAGLCDFNSNLSDREKDTDKYIVMMKEVLSLIKKWLINNPGTTLVLDGVFQAQSEISSDGEIEIGLVPAGEMKILVKDDNSIQE